jgi:hypothetical protein
MNKEAQFLPRFGGGYGLINNIVKRNHINKTTAGSAALTKISAGRNITIASAGIDLGTGDVILHSSAAPILSTYLLGKDINSIYTIIEKKRADGTLYSRYTLSGGNTPNYTTKTIIFYAANGITVLNTYAFTLSYENNKIISEVLQ